MSDSWLFQPYLPTLCPTSSSPTVATYVFFIVRNIDLVMFCHSWFSLRGNCQATFSSLLYTKRIWYSFKIVFCWFVSNREELSSYPCWVWNSNLAPVRLCVKGLLPWESHCLLAWSNHQGSNMRFWGSLWENSREGQVASCSWERTPVLYEDHQGLWCLILCWNVIDGIVLKTKNCWGVGARWGERKQGLLTVTILQVCNNQKSLWLQMWW